MIVLFKYQKRTEEKQINFLNKNNKVEETPFNLSILKKKKRRDVSLYEIHHTRYTQIKHLRILTVMPYDFPQY